MQKTKVQSRSTKDDTTVRELPMACADETAAVEFMENKRWGDHPSCPNCKSESVYKMMGQNGQRQANFRWRCKECKKQYTARTGTVFEDSRIELRHWCYAFWRAATSKKGVSALEIHRQTGVSYKSALFMLHRIRFAMGDSASELLKGPVEVDETFVGGKPRYKGKRPGPRKGKGAKQPVLAMVERGGKVKTHPIADITSKTLHEHIKRDVAWNSAIITDENWSYNGIGNSFAGGHHTTHHKSREYVRGPIHSNTVEGFFSTVKRGLNGIYHSVSKQHLASYLNEFEFRYNFRDLEDGERTLLAIKGAEGKRLMYRDYVR